jgi:glyoxylase-like metal-dependent hydrolase (beta-lactamase superfamily II)
VRLTDRVHLVGSGRLGFALTDPLDCHVYLVDGESELGLVDAGTGFAADAIVAAVEAAGFQTGAVRHLLLTHGHFDHAGGAASLRALLPHLTVYASGGIAPALRGGIESAIGLDSARVAGVYPMDTELRPCPIDVELQEGDTVVIGDLRLDVLDTPGHADGHIALVLDDGGSRSLFAGDLVFAGGRILLQPTHDCRVDAHVASLRKLRGLGIDSLFPGHFEICRDGAQAHIEAANVDLDALALPPQALKRR